MKVVKQIIAKTYCFFMQFSGVDENTMKNALTKLVMNVFNHFPQMSNYQSMAWNISVKIGSSHVFDASFKELESSINALLAGLNKINMEKSEGYIVEEVKQAIASNYNQEVSLGNVASVIGLSPNYLGIIFKQLTGYYFNDYLTNYRLEKACELLGNTQEKVNEIGEMVGIPNKSYFSSLFKKKYGVTPRGYRKIKTKKVMGVS